MGLHRFMEGKVAGQKEMKQEMDTVLADVNARVARLRQALSSDAGEEGGAASK